MSTRHCMEASTREQLMAEIERLQAANSSLVDQVEELEGKVDDLLDDLHEMQHERDDAQALARRGLDLREAVGEYYAAVSGGETNGIVFRALEGSLTRAMEEVYGC